MKRRTFNLSLCGVVSALGVAVLMITLVVPTTTYASSALAGILTGILVIECNKKWAIASYIVVSIVSVIIVPDKEAVAFYLLLFGYYPITKQIIEGHIKNKYIQLVVKIINFTIPTIACYYLSIFVLNVSPEEFNILGVNLPIVFLLIGIVVFLIFDNALTGLITLYINKYRKKLLGNIKIAD